MARVWWVGLVSELGRGADLIEIEGATWWSDLEMVCHGWRKCDVRWWICDCGLIGIFQVWLKGRGARLGFGDVVLG
jgi:hypothetical protein